MKVYLCAICNITSGVCNEDCKFCSQSVRYKADIERFRKKEMDKIIEEAKMAKANKAVGFCLVTAGKGITDDSLDFVSRAAYEVKKVAPELSLIACNGTAELWQLQELKKAGIENYNHNLETSKEFYPQICESHSWDERFQTCLNAKEAGLHLCSGGIFGLGESTDDRISMLNSLKELNPMSMPINFYHPNPALPLPKVTVPKQEAFEIIKKVREMFPNTMLMIAGGREITFGDEQYDVFKYGANALVVGDYLTTAGKNANEDIAEILARGYEIAQDCHR